MVRIFCIFTYYTLQKTSMKSINLFFCKLTLEKKAVLIILTPILTVLLNTTSMLIALAFFIIIDLITGIRKSLHEKKLLFNPLRRYFWRVLRSKGMRDTWRKTYEYGIGIIIFAIFESMVLKLDPFTIGSGTFSLTELAVITATLVEVYSIFENMESVSGRNLLKKLIFLLPYPLRRILTGKDDRDKENGNIDIDIDINNDYDEDIEAPPNRNYD